MKVVWETDHCLKVYKDHGGPQGLLVFNHTTLLRPIVSAAGAQVVITCATPSRPESLICTKSANFHSFVLKRMPDGL
jgi:hypothetical protein